MRKSKYSNYLNRRVIGSVFFFEVLCIWYIYGEYISLYGKTMQGRRWDMSTVAQQNERQVEIKNAMLFAWKGYRKHAWGADEMKPVEGKSAEPAFGGVGCTLIESLDTLLLMGLQDQFNEARHYIRTKLNWGHLKGRISVFETVIRLLGGLLGAYELSGDLVFRKRAKELGDLLLEAFDEESGIFKTYYSPEERRGFMSSGHMFRAVLAHIGSVQMELQYLSRITGDPVYRDKANAFYQLLNRTESYQNSGLYTAHFEPQTQSFSLHETVITVGASADSFYEYLLKMYQKAIQGIFEYLVVLGPPSYVKSLWLPSAKSRMHQMAKILGQIPTSGVNNTLRDKKYGHPLPSINAMGHLECFLPGLLVLGDMAEKHEKHFNVSKQLMETCLDMYARQPSQLGPETMKFPSRAVSSAEYRLRPEVIESLLYLYRATGNETYREEGWKIFRTMNTTCRTAFGFSGLRDVTEIPVAWDDAMPSYFFAETLKYHYLLQSPSDLISFNDYVLTTEGHPLSVIHRN